MKQLLNDCSYTDIWVSPENWKTISEKSAFKKTWYVQCNFFDPAFKDKYPKGFPYRKKLNKQPTLEKRQAAVALYLTEIPKLFEEKGWNPITKKFMLPPEPETTNGPTPEELYLLKRLVPELYCVDAIELAWDKILEAEQKKVDKNNKNPFSDVKQAKNRFVKGLKELHFDKIIIKDLKTSEIKETLVYLNLPDASYNKFLSYMSKIFTELIEYGCIENNPFKLFKKKATVSKPREILEEEEFIDIMDYLEEHNYDFFRYGMIFHMSGGRSTELFLVQKKDVDIKKQEFRVLVKKGNQYNIETKVIMLDVLPFWKEIIKECKSDDDYLFSKGLKPGKVSISARQISRRWNRHIKTNYNEKFKKNVTADFYALKHLFLDKLDAMQNENRNIPENAAQTLASHTTSKITNSVYLINKKKRERDALKTIKVA